VAVSVVLAGLLLSVSGCFVSSALSGLEKIQSGQWSQLTGDEILALVQGGSLLGVELPFELTAAQADAIATFLHDNDINNEDDLEAILDQLFSDPSSIVVPDGLLEIFLADVPSSAGTERTTNQGGGTLITAVEKVLDGEASTLTPDEIQVVVDKRTEGDAHPQELTDAQAQAISDFLVLNEIDTVDEWNAVHDAGTATIPDGAEELFD
jgi:hypothetical protein